MSDSMNLDELMKLVKLKKESPKEYDDLLMGIKEIMKDMLKMAMDVARDLE